MKKIIGALCACICILLASCSDDGDNRGASTTKDFTKCFAYVSELSSGATATYTMVNYQLTLFYGNYEAELLISGLRLPDGTTYPTITLSGLNWKITEGGWYEIEGRNLKPKVAVVGEAPVFTTFKLRFLPRRIDDATADGFCVRYIINNKFAVTSAYARHSVFGETESTSVTTGSEYRTTDTDYELFFNVETSRLEITMKNARFVQAMPQHFDIVLKNIPFTIVGTEAQWAVPSVIPEIGGVPYKDYEITNLDGTFDFGDDFEMTFSCNPPRHGQFNVEVDCDYTTVK